MNKFESTVAKMKTINIHHLLLIVMGLLILHWYWLIEGYGVNMLFLDQWNILYPIIKQEGLWAAFSQLNGPHRQGLGGIIQYVIYPLSGWNTQWEAYVAVFFLALTTLIAVRIKQRLTGTLTLADLCIPFLFLSLQLYESILVAPNLSHGVLPLFLFFLSAYVMCCVADRWQGPVLAFLVLLTTYTGFAFFSTVLMIPFLFIKFWRSIDKGLQRTFFFSGVFALFFGGSFFYNYTLQPAVLCFKFPHDRPWEYLTYSFHVFNNALGLYELPTSIQIIFHQWLTPIPFILLTGLWLGTLYRLVHKKMSSTADNILFYLISISLLFYALTAVGRVCLGPESARAPRYLMYAIPTFFAIYLILTKWLPSSRWKSLLMTILFLLLVSKEVRLHQYLPSRLQEYKMTKLTWKECYLQHKSIQKCNKQVGMVIVMEESFSEDFLRIMEKNKLHIFR